MAPRPAHSVADQLRVRAKALDRYVQRVETLSGRGDLPAADLKYAYVGAFVSFYTETEQRIEELFLGLMMGRIQAPRQAIRGLVSIESDVVARGVLRGDRAYVDWLPFDKFTRKRARAFFSGGEPFETLDRAHVRALERASVLRNAIAHKSGSAQRAFRTQFVDGKSLPVSEQSPAGYLRGFHAPGQRRINLIFSEVVAAISSLCS